MARKGTKIKRYGSIYERRKGSIIIAVLMAIGLAVFGIAGWLLYTPVHNFIMGLGEQNPVASSEDVTSLPESQSQIAQSEVPSADGQPQEPVKKEEIKGVYLPVSQLLDAAAFDTALNKLKETDINTVVVEAKDAAGTVLYSSSNAVAKSSGVAAPSVYNAQKVADAIKAAGISPAVKLHAFKDAAAPAADRDMAVHYYDTDIYWLDNSPELGGKMWLNPYSHVTQEYILSLIEELCKAGFETVMLDSVQFPDGVALDKAGYGAEAASKSKAQVLAEFVDKAVSVVEKYGTNLVICTDSDWLAPSAENLNQYLYGGTPDEFFTDVTAVMLDGDSSVWKSRVDMLKGHIKGEMLVIAPAFANDGTLVDGNALTEQINTLKTNGYLLYDPQGNYKFN